VVRLCLVVRGTRTLRRGGVSPPSAGAERAGRMPAVPVARGPSGAHPCPPCHAPGAWLAKARVRASHPRLDASEDIAGSICMLRSRSVNIVLLRRKLNRVGSSHIRATSMNLYTRKVFLIAFEDDPSAGVSHKSNIRRTSN